MSIATKEGYIKFRNFKTWFRIVGESEQKGKFPLLCLHGGPGMAHDYLESLEELARTGRRIIFYDQLGCGNSDHPHDPSLWNLKLFIDELKAIRNSLGLDFCHLLGQSWGGFLAQEYILTGPAGIMSLILSNSSASTGRWISEANRLRSALPPKIQKTLKEHEMAGTTDDPEYASATDFYYRIHLCRLENWPDCLNRTLAKLGQDPEVYNTMWGPSEFHCTGMLKNWDIENRLPEIKVPTLILSGRYDESTPTINEVLNKGIHHSEWVIFEESSHLSHLEEPNAYLSVVSDFLDRVETR